MRLASSGLSIPSLRRSLRASGAAFTRVVGRRDGLLFALFTLISSARFGGAVWMIYLAANGYSPLAIGLFEMGFHLAKFIAEVPTGIFADLVGRRASLIVSCVLGGLAELPFLHPTPALIALSFALSGTAYAFHGGADSALLWGLARRESRSAGVEPSATVEAQVAGRFSRLYSVMFIVMLVGETVAVAAGGFLSDVRAVLPFVAQGAMVAGAALPLLWLRPEDDHRPVHAGLPSRPHPLAHFATGARVVWRDPLLLALLLLSGLLAGVFTTVNLYGQLFFSGMGLSVAAVGLIFGATIGPDALFAALAPRLINRFAPAALLGGCVLAEVLGLLAMTSGSVVLGIAGFLLLFHAADGVVMSAVSRYLNERAPEEQRATVLSLDTGLFSATMIVLFPLFGLGLAHISFDSAYRWVLVVLLVGSALIGGSAWLARRAHAALGSQECAS